MYQTMVDLRPHFFRESRAISRDDDDDKAGDDAETMTAVDVGA